MSADLGEESLRNKSDQEIIQMTAQLHQEARVLGEAHAKTDEKLRIATENFRQLMPNISEVQETAQKRTDLLEKKRRLEKKIAAIVMRYPGILDNAGKPHIISGDISILKRQLDRINGRKEVAIKTFNELEKKRDDLERKMAELRGETRREGEILRRRDQDKAKLTQALTKELETAKNLHVSEGRIIDRKITMLNQKNLELSPELEDLKKEYRRLCNLRTEMLGAALPANINPSQTLDQKRETLTLQLDNFLSFWKARRMARLWTDRQDYLEDVSNNTKERRGHTYNSIKVIQEMNQARNIELTRHRTMIADMERETEKLKQRNVTLEAEVQKTKQRLKNRNDQSIGGGEREQKVRQLQETRDRVQFECRMAEYQVASLERDGVPTRSERCYASAREKYRKALYDMSERLLSVRKLKDELAQLEASAKQKSLMAMESQCFLSEEDKVVVVQAASLNVLAQLLFNPGNIDKYFIPGMLVFAHTDKSVSYSAVMEAILNAYMKTEYVDTRAQRLREFLDKLGEWFAVDHSDKDKRAALTPLFNAIGSSGILASPTHDSSEVTWDKSVPFNDREEMLVFSATPEILVEHFSYLELQILRQIPAHEFIGTAWAAVDKWERAPHIVSMVDHFNTITQWIVESVVLEDRVEKRIALVDRWIKVMKAAKEMGNFQLVFEIFGALCSPVLSRLLKTMDGLAQNAKDLKEEFREFTTPKGRFQNYRNELEKFAPEVVVPYIGPMLTSLVYVADGNPSKRTLPGSGESVPNFSKYRSYAMIMSGIFANWGSELKFVLNQDLFKKVSNIPPAAHGELELFEMAGRKEPPGG